MLAYRLDLLSFSMSRQKNIVYGKVSEGFKVVIHKQDEFIDEWEGINVGPGQHVVIALSEKRVTFSSCFQLKELCHALIVNPPELL